MFYSLFRGSLFISLLATLSPTARGGEVKPSLIFSGDAQRQHVVALDQYNRVSFGPESMTLTHSDDPTALLQLPYSSYNLFSIGEAEPTASISDIVAEAPTQSALFAYDAAIQSLRSTSVDLLNISVYNLAGHCLLTATLAEGETLPVDTLIKGIYLAKAETKSTTNTIKFIKQ